MTAHDRPPGPEGGPIAETIARVKQLDAKATPGPWVGEPDGGPHRGRVEERSARGIETVAYTYCGAYDGHGARNAELVAYYRTATPLLAAECERLRDENARLAERRESAADVAKRLGFSVTDERKAANLRHNLGEAAPVYLAAELKRSELIEAECERLRERVGVLEEALRQCAADGECGLELGAQGSRGMCSNVAHRARAALKGSE